MDAAGPDYAYACPSCALTTGFSPPLSSSGTLVIAPSSIVEQWSNEAATHAPSLSVVVFTGMEKTPVTARQMTRFDMVITSYDTIRKELHAAKPEPGRSRRQGRRYERRRSPLVGVTFWRVVLDEAQMVESSVSHAAAMACMIPRVHPWAVTGTPIAKKGLADLHGLIKFLRLEPLASYPAIWQRLQEPINRGLFYDTLRRFMHRNTKANVSTELTIPAQHARTLHLDFSKVERTWYDQLYDEMIAEVRATPKRASDGAEDVRASTMSLWLLQLRQTCCHPQVGTHNRRVLGGVLRSIGEVLDLMYRQAKTAVSGTERQFCLARIHRAQMLEFIAKNKEWQDGGDAPLEVYRAVRADLQRSITAVSKQRAEILQKQKLVYVPSVADPRESQERNLLEDDEQEMEHIGNQDTISELNEELTALTARLRNLQELEHRVIYFTASVYHSCKSEELENQFYREAELIRRQLLGPEQEAACKLIDLYKSYAQKVEQKAILKVDMISDCVLPLSGGFMRDLSKSLRDIAQQLDDQWKVLCSWRDVIVKKLTCPIKTEDATDPERKIEQETDGVTVSGKDEATVETVEEYQEGIEMQAIVDVYQACYRLMLADRKQLLTGIRAEDRRLEVVTEAKEEKELRLVLEKKRRSFILTPGSLPLRELIGELQKAKNRHLPELEKRLLLNAAHTLPKVLERELARHKMLESETRAISKVFNSRLSYYMNLQRVSDGVVPAVEPADIDADIAETVSNESEMQRALVAQVARVRYLENMTREERGSDDDGTTEGAAERQKEWECLICKSPVVEGLITPCGHVYCTDCVTGWINRHKKCPLCNQPLWIKQCKPVSMRQTKRSLPVMSSQPSSSSSPSSPSSEQEQASQILLGHLANIPLLGSYGTKLDTLITHIKYLRMLDPKSKSLVFSQWEQVLDYLGQGLAKNNVQFVKLNQGRAALKGQSAVKRFREDDNVQVIMLNARSQSAGLTLVGANNVFLIEPVVNLALEAQAINRVHRIGQTRETTVWRYIIRDSIEERVAALGQRSRASFNGCSEGDAVNESSKPGLETRAGGGGERVEQSDVRWCLFGDLSPPECTAPSSPAPSAAAPSLSPSPLQPSSPIPQSSTASPRRSLSPPPVLDDSANAFLVTLERRLAAVGDSQDEEGGGVHPPYTSRRGRGMAGKRRYIS
ncbi:SNF2 family N-terminal domain-containing protein [Powellomyces hirtus]|nr:SNF2 family N-terminal domain-containing protein [Powellomyces hirtus]